MKTASTKTYRENRARYSLEELRKWDGQWVAFSIDGQRIVAGAATITEVCDQVKKLPEDQREIVLERIELDAVDSNLGGAEYL